MWLVIGEEWPRKTLGSVSVYLPVLARHVVRRNALFVVDAYAGFAILCGVLLLREDGANDGFSIRAIRDVREMMRTVITASTAIELRLIIFLHVESYVVVNSRGASDAIARCPQVD